MSLINVISALGNNNSIYPLLVRDCGIENLAKCTMTYTTNAKESKFIAYEATRERIIDEYGTSAVWLGGIPLLELICDKAIKKLGFSPKVNLKLFNETNYQGINLNIKKFKNLAPNAVKDLEKVKANKSTFQNFQGAKFLATTLIPITLMGFILPKLNFLYTKKKLVKTSSNKQNSNKQLKNPNYNLSFNAFQKMTKKVQTPNSKLNFCGIEKLANMSNLQKMMILDGGLTVGRVKTGRNKGEKAEMAFKMGAMCYLNYIAPKNIEKGLNKLTKTIFGINTDLDVKVLNDKDFIKQIKDKSLNLPKGNSEKEIIDFIDSNITSAFTKQIENLGLVSILKNNVRDPRKFVETDKIAQFKQAIEEFSQNALKSGNVEQYAKKALRAKSFNTITNVALSSFLLAIALPKVQFLLRKLITGSNLDPGIKNYAQNNQTSTNKINQ